MEGSAPFPCVSTLNYTCKEGYWLLGAGKLKCGIDKQVRHSSLCRAVQDGFLLSDLPDLRLLLVKLIAKTQASILLSDLPDLWLLLVKLIAETQANTCLSCPISCSTTPGVTRTSSTHVVCARHPHTSSVHVIHARRPHVVCSSSPRCLCVICACAYVVRTRTHHLHIIYTSSALLPMVTRGLNYLLL